MRCFQWSLATLGWNLESIDCNFGDGTCQVWDISGQLPELWVPLADKDAIVFVVDSSEVERRNSTNINEAREALYNLLEAGSQKRKSRGGVPLLIFANKHDKCPALSAREIADSFGLEEQLHRHIHRWHIQECSAMNNEGIQEGWDWLIKNI